jgi:hypothetical protein
LLNFWELIIIEVIVGVHINDFCFAWRTHYLDDLNQLIKITLSHKEWLTLQNLKQYTPRRPNVDHSCVCCAAEDQLRRAIASRTNVGDIGFTLH